MHLVVDVCCKGMGSEVLGTSKFSPLASRSIVYTKLYSQIQNANYTKHEKIFFVYD